MDDGRSPLRLLVSLFFLGAGEGGVVLPLVEHVGNHDLIAFDVVEEKVVAQQGAAIAELSELGHAREAVGDGFRADETELALEVVEQRGGGLLAVACQRCDDALKLDRCGFLEAAAIGHGAPSSF